MHRTPQIQTRIPLLQLRNNLQEETQALSSLRRNTNRRLNITQKGTDATARSFPSLIPILPLRLLPAKHGRLTGAHAQTETPSQTALRRLRQKLRRMLELLAPPTTKYSLLNKLFLPNNPSLNISPNYRNQPLLNSSHNLRIRRISS